MHTKGLVHLDIKAANILLDERLATAKLADVGLSRTLLASGVTGAHVQGPPGLAGAGSSPAAAGAPRGCACPRSTEMLTCPPACLPPPCLMFMQPPVARCCTPRLSSWWGGGAGRPPTASPLGSSAWSC